MIYSAAGSVTSPARSNNEDSYRVGRISDDVAVLIIADGLGGCPAGEVASAVASDSMLESMESTDLAGSADADIISRIYWAFNKANIDILRNSMEHPEHEGMCSTLTVAVIRNEELFVGHYGDCRCYLVRNGVAECLTEDHNLAAQMVREGRISREEAKTHYGRSSLINCLGENRFIKPDINRYDIISGDCVILASDGLYSLMDENMTRDISEHRNNVEELVRVLLERGDSRYAKDNATVVAAYVERP
ncbi:protein phosphatase [Ruminococcaceae bacterium YRB3002]|nr:protein phosphatase [Ruminococcaceae bacterium YRB3002]